MATLTNLRNKENITIENYATLGRASRCTLTLKDRKLSRIHCEIILWNGDFFIIDLHSQNGTRVNNKNIFETILKDQDVIEIGKTQLVFSAS